MIIQVDDIEFNILVDESEISNDKLPIIFLHGFTGQSSDWHFIFDKLNNKYLPIAIDLIGHGKSSSPDNPDYYSTDAITRQINRIIRSLGLKKIILVGYSMGGRAALSYCCKYNPDIRAAILESSTPGIRNFEQKKERVEFDFLLSERIKTEGVDKFLDYWFSIPLFESLKDIDNLENVKNQRKQNSVIGLSNMLAGFSTGLMPDYWDRLRNINFPVLLISGELDEKYTMINSEMSKLIPESEHIIVKNCGHNVHLENPELFIKFVDQFLSSHITSR